MFHMGWHVRMHYNVVKRARVYVRLHVCNACAHLCVCSHGESGALLARGTCAEPVHACIAAENCRTHAQVYSNSVKVCDGRYDSCPCKESMLQARACTLAPVQVQT